MNFSKSEVVRYPSQVYCDKCLKNVFPFTSCIDSSTWDLVCSCGEIVYFHPLREERIKELKLKTNN